MKKDSTVRPYIKRLAIIFLICLIFVILFNEGTYLFQAEGGERAPQSIQIVIPEGTSERVAAGEPVPSIPAGLTFVAGDVLEVINLDKADHQLGPLWIPAGTTASLALDLPEKLSFACTFSTGKYLDIEVRPVTSITDRITAIALAAPTMTALIFLYSLAAKPLDQEKLKKEQASAGLKG